MARVFAIVLNPRENEQDKFEINEPQFLPEENSLVILKTGTNIVRAVVVRVENVLERVGQSADLIFNVFVKILPPEENVN